MTATQVSSAINMAAFIVFFGVIVWWIFNTPLKRFATRLFPNFMARRALRSAQRLDDRLEADRRARELENERMFDWAIVHPDTPEGSRHLEKERDEVQKRLRWVNAEVESSTLLLKHSSESERSEREAKLADAKQRQAKEAERFDRINAALEGESAFVAEQ